MPESDADRCELPGGEEVLGELVESGGGAAELLVAIADGGEQAVALRQFGTKGAWGKHSGSAVQKPQIFDL